MEFSFWERLHLFLENFEFVLFSGIRYVLVLILFFGVFAAVFSVFSGDKTASLLITSEGTTVITAIVVLSLLLIWREVREVRIWLGGISEGHSKGIYSRLENPKAKSRKK